MSFKYVNPGYKAMLNDPYDYAFQVENSTSEQTKTGVCWAIQGYQQVGTPILATPSGYYEPAVDELWLKVDFYIPADVRRVNFRIYPAYERFYYLVIFQVYGEEGAETYQAYTAVVCSYPTYFNGEESASASLNSLDEVEENSGLKIGKINTVKLHCVFDNSSMYQRGSISAELNGKQKITIEQPDSNGNRWSEQSDGIYTNFYSFTGNGSSPFISNLIISDEEINVNEKIIPLPIKETNSTMSTLSGGLYLADKVGQKISQSIDVAAIADIYGADSPLTGIFLAGYPAYTDSGTGRLTAFSKIGSDTTQHGTFEVTDTDTQIVEYSDEYYGTWTEEVPATTYAFCSWAASDMTISDLNGMEFGWKASE